MQTTLPGRPQTHLQALSTGVYQDQTVVCYISGSALIVCNAPESILQTIYHDDVPWTSSGLVAVAYDQRSAKIATASADNVYVYELREEVKGQLRWILIMTFSINQDEDQAQEEKRIQRLSWGTDEELLVASDKLSLLSTKDQSTCWTRSLPSRVSHAAFSPSASLLATLSQHDRLVKIWRRLSFESATFDYAYLAHPDLVTHVEWQSNASDEDVLYTICLDGRLRVWKRQQTHVLGLYAELDLMTAVRPLVPSNRRYACIIPSSVFSKAANHILGNPVLSAERHSVEYMKEIGNKHPDIVVVTDDQGHMSAWGLENVGCKRRSSVATAEHADFFHATHVEKLFFDFAKHAAAHEDNARIINVQLAENSGDLVFLLHHFDGRIQWYQGRVHHVFDPSPRTQRMPLLATWTGHSSRIKKLIRTANGVAVISRTEADEGIVWRHHANSLVRKSKTKLSQHIHRTVLLNDGDFVVLLHCDGISLWDARLSNAKQVGRCSYSVSGKPLCLLLLPTPEDAGHFSYLATVTSEMHGLVWELDLALAQPTIEQYCTFQLDRIENMSYFLPVDPAGSSQVISGFLDTFAKDVAISWTSTGLVQTWAANIDRTHKSVTWLNISTTDTGIRTPALGSGTSIRKAALVDKSCSKLTIWDTKSGRLDYEETFTNQTIQDLDWASTPDNQSILAVGFAHAVFVYTQLRYDYVNERPSWARIKEVTTRHLSPHPIGDSVWLRSGSLVIGAGNQLYLVDNHVSPHKELAQDLQSSISNDTPTLIHDLVRRLNGPLPVYHPQFISQCILAGKMDIVHRILLNLQKSLKFYTEGDDLDTLQGLGIDDFMSSKEIFTKPGKQIHKSYSKLDMQDEPSTVTEEVATSINSLLGSKSIPNLSNTEQLSLVDIVECVGVVEKHRRSVDVNATRFLLFWRETIMRSRQSSSTTAVSWREMLWAFHSTSQDILVDLVTRQNKGQMTWSHARDTGVFVWLTDREALLQQFEAVAKSAYTSTDLRDPVNCSLHYIALRKKNVLLGLWRMATWSREQAATMRLLKNDFTDPRWKTAANKNAYALMGRRRFEYAATFFLLADNLDSAVSVLSNQLGDVQLAIAVARVYGGDDSPSLKKLLSERLLPNTVRDGNRYQATWIYWMLGQRSLAVRALVSPLHSLLTPPGPPPESLFAKSFLKDDPALVILYQQLREKSLQTLKGALKITGKEEWEFITKTATLLLRMGCDILALNLVRHWEFLQPQPLAVDNHDEPGEEKESVGDLPRRKLSRTVKEDVDPRKLLRRRSSMVVADLPEARPIVHNDAVPSMLDAWDVPQSKTKSSSSLLDHSAGPSSKPATTPSMLEKWSESKESKPSPATTTSMLDDWMPPSKPAPSTTPSLLDDWLPQSQPVPKAAPSLLDDWTTPIAKAKSNEPQATAPSMLDQSISPPPAAKQQITKPPPSILDDWAEPVSKAPIQATKILSVDDSTASKIIFTTSAPLNTAGPSSLPSERTKSTNEVPEFLNFPTMPTSMPNSAGEERVLETPNNGTKDLLTLKERAENGGGKQQSKQNEEENAAKTPAEDSKPWKSQKPPPKEFKEPDPNSLLDAFGL